MGIARTDIQGMQNRSHRRHPAAPILCTDTASPLMATAANVRGHVGVHCGLRAQELCSFRFEPHPFAPGSADPSKARGCCRCVWPGCRRAQRHATAPSLLTGVVPICSHVFLSFGTTNIRSGQALQILHERIAEDNWPLIVEDKYLSVSAATLGLDTAILRWCGAQ